MKKRVLCLAMAIIAAATMFGCTKITDTPEGGVRTVTIAYSPSYKPITYQDADGKEAGYDIEVFKKIDELLTDYEFVYEAVDKDTMNMGVEAGTYQVGINGLFKNSSRLQTYLMTEQPMGGTPIGLVVKEDNDTIKDFDSAVATNAVITPISTIGGIYGVILQYNEEHPDAPIVFDAVSDYDRASYYAAIAAGTYDYTADLVTVFYMMSESVTAGVKMTDTFMVVPTYPIINKNETELAAKIEEALVTLYKNGTLSTLAVQYYGEDITVFWEK